LSGTLGYTTPADATSNVGNYAITPGGQSATNYALTFAPGTLSVTPAPLTVTAGDATRLYGGANPSFSASYAGFVNGETPAILSGTLGYTTPADATSAVGNYAITPGGQSATNYALTFAPGTLSVTPAPLTVTAGDVRWSFGEDNPSPTTQYAGFVLGETPEALGGRLVFSIQPSPSSAPREYAIVPAGLESTNYDVRYVPGVLRFETLPSSRDFRPGEDLGVAPDFELDAAFRADSRLAPFVFNPFAPPGCLRWNHENLCCEKLAGPLQSACIHRVVSREGTRKLLP
jgi:hypothetical protein